MEYLSQQVTDYLQTLPKQTEIIVYNFHFNRIEEQFRVQIQNENWKLEIKCRKMALFWINKMMVDRTEQKYRLIIVNAC